MHTLVKKPILAVIIAASALVGGAGAQVDSNAPRPNSFMIQSFQAGSTTDIDYILVKDLDSGAGLPQRLRSSIR